MTDNQEPALTDLDHSLSDVRRLDAGRRLLNAPDMPVPEPYAIRVGLDDLRGRPK